MRLYLSYERRRRIHLLSCKSIIMLRSYTILNIGTNQCCHPWDWVVLGCPDLKYKTQNIFFSCEFTCMMGWLDRKHANPAKSNSNRIQFAVLRALLGQASGLIQLQFHTVSARVLQAACPKFCIYVTFRPGPETMLSLYITIPIPKHFFKNAGTKKKFDYQPSFAFFYKSYSSSTSFLFVFFFGKTDKSYEIYMSTSLKIKIKKKKRTSTKGTYHFKDIPPLPLLLLVKPFAVPFT